MSRLSRVLFKLRAGRDYNWVLARTRATALFTLQSSIGDGLIGQHQEIFDNARVERVSLLRLGQKHCQQIFLRICYPRCAKDTRPVERTNTWPQSETPGSDRDPIAKAPVVPHAGSTIYIVAIKFKRSVRVLLRGQIVCRHGFHRLARENTDAIEFSPVQQHAAKTLVIVGSGDQAACSRRKERRFSPTCRMRIDRAWQVWRVSRQARQSLCLPSRAARKYSSAETFPAAGRRRERSAPPEYPRLHCRASGLPAHRAGEARPDAPARHRDQATQPWITARD